MAIECVENKMSRIAMYSYKNPEKNNISYSVADKEQEVTTRNFYTQISMKKITLK